jgi:hypothetical protein
LENPQGVKSAADPGARALTGEAPKQKGHRELTRILCVLSIFVVKDALMTARNLKQLEADFFRNLNQVVEPLVRAGLGSPLPWTTGAIVLETTGRKTGRSLSVPLLATLVGDLLLVSTVRKGSQWVKNLATNSEVTYWIYGEQRSAKAFVFAETVAPPTLTEMPVVAACLASALLPQSKLFGVSFAILVPR